MNDQDNKNMTVSQYFKDTHQKILEFGKLPCLVVNKNNKKIYFPLEVCVVMSGLLF